MEKELKAMNEIASYFRNEMKQEVWYAQEANGMWEICIGNRFADKPWIEMGGMNIDQLVEVISSLTGGFRPSTHPVPLKVVK